MVSVSNNVISELERRSVWDAFRPDERQQLIDDDIQAGKSVALVLTAVIALGTAIGIFAVLLTT